jgi:hypothetical protein
MKLTETEGKPGSRMESRKGLLKDAEFKITVFKKI